jgi:hypothetical protein
VEVAEQNVAGIRADDFRVVAGDGRMPQRQVVAAVPPYGEGKAGDFNGIWRQVSC